MSYSIELINNEKYKPTFWSGGTATELITYPEKSDYASRNFLWRLGIAKIDILESTFSLLPDISRKFMVTEGQITLNHENKYIKLLNSFDQDSFMGDWKTTTYGKASVFNLMTKENYHGDLLHFCINPKKQINFEYESSLYKDIVAICFYIAYGRSKVTIAEKLFNMNNNDLLHINCVDSNIQDDFLFSNDSLEDTHIIASIIFRS